jgi:16S rRNA A1518/A1519 N6-dimethyltransferase RsmA/KsgA/DIM1 with predicted DNA glycosylase/AP lyase activity
VDLDALYDAAGLDGTERAETLRVDQFVAMAKAYQALKEKR